MTACASPATRRRGGPRAIRTARLAAVGLEDMLLDADQEKVDRVMAALLEMGKLDIAELEQAAAA